MENPNYRQLLKETLDEHTFNEIEKLAEKLTEEEKEIFYLVMYDLKLKK